MSIAYEVLSGEEGWRTKWEYYSRNISTLEPFLESSAQLVIKLCIWTFFAQHHLEQDREENPLISKDREFIFYVSTCISALTTVFGIVKFFKDGLVRFLPQSGPIEGFLTLRFIFTFLAVLLSSAAKILLFLLLLFYSLGVLAVALQQPTGIDLVGTKSNPKCSNLALVHSCSDGSFIVKYHSADPDTVLLWGDQDAKDWRVFLREEGQGVRMFWNANRSQWWEGFHERCVSDGIGCDFNLPSVCGEYSNLYCADQILGLDIVTLSRLISFCIWFCLNLFPQLLVAALILLAVDVKGALKIFLHLPQLMISPSLTNITFGVPQKLLCQCKAKESKEIVFSKLMYSLNSLLAFFGQIVSLYILYIHHYWTNPSVHEDFVKFLIHSRTLLGGDKDNFNLDFIPPGLVLLFHLLSVAFFSIVIHIPVCDCESPFLAPLDCQKIPLTSIVPRLKEEMLDVEMGDQDKDEDITSGSGECSSL